MVENEKSSSIASSYSLLLLEVWKKWDVRGMILFSLTLQIILCVLGRRRKYKIHYFFKAILWFVYLGADWIAIATLGKLSGSHAESAAANVLRAYWAPLLLVHLAGPDTITAYAFEDNKLWIRHLVILVVKVILVIYIVCLSWTFSWLSFFTLPLILAGIIKYVEKILCLKLNNSQKINPIISNMFNGQGCSEFVQNRAFNILFEKNSNVLSGYLLFTIVRPDVNDYLSSENLSDVETRIKTYLRETTGIDGGKAVQFAKQYLPDNYKPDIFEVLSIQQGFAFDVLYTKASVIYSKSGCFLRFTSYISCVSVLLLFFINIINEPKFHSSRIDIAITGILLSGAVAQEYYAAWEMLSSDWTVLVAEFQHNVLVRKLLKFLSKDPCSMHQGKRWSNQIGQFDLLKYCWHYGERQANQSHGFLPKVTIGNEIAEIWHKYRFTKFVDVSCVVEKVIHLFQLSSASISENSLKTTRGEKTLQICQQFDNIKRSIELEFDHSIIIWHLATSVCYYLQGDNHANNYMKVSKHVSDYMMYLLAMCPALLLSEHSKSFWLDHTYDNLKKLVSSATDIKDAAFRLHANQQNARAVETESSEETFENLKREVLELATFLEEQSDDKWEMISDVWLEMLVYAAVSSQHINHVRQLGEGIEFLSLIRHFKGLFMIHTFVQGLPE